MLQRPALVEAQTEPVVVDAEKAVVFQSKVVHPVHLVARVSGAESCKDLGSRGEFALLRHPLDRGNHAVAGLEVRALGGLPGGGVERQSAIPEPYHDEHGKDRGQKNIEQYAALSHEAIIGRERR